MFTTGIASIQLVNMSIVMNRNLNPPGALAKAPMMSIPQIVNGREINGPKRIDMLCGLLLEKTDSPCTW
jgi:hypothetical protein